LQDIQPGCTDEFAGKQQGLL
jgi:hypothetical protein